VRGNQPAEMTARPARFDQGDRATASQLHHEDTKQGNMRASRGAPSVSCFVVFVSSW
jgi:hypothetical protein